MKIIRSFHYAIQGILYTIRNERNFRIHMTVSVYVLFFSLFYNLTKAEYAILALVLAGVMSSEILNTAIEEAVNLLVEKYDVKAKHAKDMAAGGVLVYTIGAVAVGWLLFWDLDTIKNIFWFLFSDFWYTAAFCCSLVLSVIFIKGEQKQA